MKPGIKSTELYVAIGGVIVIGVLRYFEIVDEATAKQITAVLMAYIASRGLSKLMNGKK